MADDDYYYYDDEDNAYVYEEEGYEGAQTVNAASASDDGGALAKAGEKALTAVMQGDAVRNMEPAIVLESLRLSAERVSNLFMVSRAFALLLLRRYNFNEDLADAQYVMDATGQCRELGMTVESAKAADNTFVDVAAAAATCPSTSGEAEAAVEDSPMCAICCFEDGDEAGNALYALSNCHHFFCLGCWRDYVLERLKMQSSLFVLRCPSAGCQERVDAIALLDFAEKMEAAEAALDNTKPEKASVGASDPSADEAAPVLTTSSLPLKVRRAILSEYITNNPRLSWCPNPESCEKILFCPPSANAAPLRTCDDCGFPFCGLCKQAAHAPASCETMTNWKVMLDKDGASLAHILQKTKACPKCRNRIEKNLGCNHMTCRCGHQFCWICMGDWKSHTSSEAYNCQGKPTAPARADETVADRRNRIFFEYFTDYDAHITSLRQETRMIAAVSTRVAIIREKQRDMFDFTISEEVILGLMESMQRCLRLARLTLSATYIEAYRKRTAEGEDAAVDQMLLLRRGKLMVATEGLSQALQSFVHPATSAIDVESVREKITLTTRLTQVFYD